MHWCIARKHVPTKVSVPFNCGISESCSKIGISENFISSQLFGTFSKVYMIFFYFRFYSLTLLVFFLVEMALAALGNNNVIIS